MRPLKTKTDRQFGSVIALIAIAAIVLSTIGFVLWWREPEQNNGEEIRYGNYTFIRTHYGWQTKVQSIELNTRYLPQEVINISSQGKPSLSDFERKRTLYIVAENEVEREAAREFYVLEAIVLRIQPACSPEEENSTFCLQHNLPIKSCKDVGFDTAVIIVNETENSTVNFERGCLSISGKEIDLFKASSKALFMIFGII